jgi:hypothetical protein
VVVGEVSLETIHQSWAVVEATIAAHLLHVAVLVEEQASLLDAAGEEGDDTHQRHSYHLGDGEPDLRVVPLGNSLQELFAQAGNGDDGIVPASSSQSGKKILCDLQIGGIMTVWIGGELGYDTKLPALQPRNGAASRREMLVWVGTHFRSYSMATTTYC